MRIKREAKREVALPQLSHDRAGREIVLLTNAYLVFKDMPLYLLVMWVNTCNPLTGEVEAEGSEHQG